MYFVSMTNKSVYVDPSAYSPLLNLIARAESNDNYNAYYGNANNRAVDFTSMTIEEVLQWQDQYVRQGSRSSAVGRYQIINKTLAGLVAQLDIDTKQKFDKPMQDQLAVALLERRGAREYMNDKISTEEFAANLAKEWAALPRIIGANASESYYASDGINRSRVSVNEVLAVIEEINV